MGRAGFSDHLVFYTGGTAEAQWKEGSHSPQWWRWKQCRERQCGKSIRIWIMRMNAVAFGCHESQIWAQCWARVSRGHSWGDVCGSHPTVVWRPDTWLRFNPNELSQMRTELGAFFFLNKHSNGWKEHNRILLIWHFHPKCFAKDNIKKILFSFTVENLDLLDLLSVTVKHNVKQGISIIEYSKRVFYLCAWGLISRLPGRSVRTWLDYDYEEWKVEKKGRKLRQTGRVIWVSFQKDENKLTALGERLEIQR